MAKDRNGTSEDKSEVMLAEEDDREARRTKSRSKSPYDSDLESEEREDSKRRHSSRREKSKSRKRRHRSRNDTDSYSESGSDCSDSDSEYSDSEESEYSDSESEEEEEEDKRRRRKRREKKRREEEDERERKRRRRKREKEKRKRREREEREKERRKKRKEKEKRRKEKKEKGKKGAVTDSWGKYGIIRETDMWNKRPEFTAWLAEVKQVNLEGLANWEEKQMFKEFMEDHNTATFPSKKYYNLDAYHKRQMEKEMKKGFKKVKETERTVFNDEEQRRQELLREREKQKEEQVEGLKRVMQSGMAQAMKEQARLREEMAYQYKLGNFEAAAAIQRRLDPDVAM